VLGIIGKDGTMAQQLTLPVQNLHLVPDQLSDQEACFSEPLSAACRILEQGLLEQGGLGGAPQAIAVVGALAMLGSARMPDDACW
jgi:threonine dehydrogenase-like Zn-dependent dehydrogenase